jgi:hypothetical protein
MTSSYCSASIGIQMSLRRGRFDTGGEAVIVVAAL